MLEKTSKQRVKIPSKINDKGRLTSTEIKQNLQVFALAYDPSEFTQRQFFKTIMPELFVLRRKGFSFKEITTLLNNCGLQLQPSTVREYYTDFQQECQEACDARIEANLKMLANLDQINTLESNQKLVEATLLAKKATVIRSSEETLAIMHGEKNVAPPQVAAKSQLQANKPAIGESGAGKPSSARSSPTGKNDGFNYDEPVIPMLSPSEHEAAPAKSIGISDEDPSIPDLAEAPSNNGSIKTQSRNGLKCLKLKPDVKKVLMKPGVPKEVYESDELMEHPSIKGLMLTKQERLYDALLEYTNEDGEIIIELVSEKFTRTKWRPPIPTSTSSTEDSFVKMSISS